MTEERLKADSHDEPSAKPAPKTGFSRLGPAIRHSVAGFLTTLRTETAFRQELSAFVVLLPLALWLGGSTVERVLLAAPLFLVLIVELLNTALESAVDRLGTQFNTYAKAAKDAGSAAVFVSLLLVLFTWVMVLVGKLGA
jgi:diacylglycerol kinase (ATP)